MDECYCKNLNHWLDAQAMGYKRNNCVVIYSRSKKIIRTCASGHTIEPFKYKLADPTYPGIAKGIAMDELRVIVEFDGRGERKQNGDGV
jgi:hypothetical protein